MSYTITFLLIALLNLNAQVQLGPDIDGEAIGDNSGWSVSLSADGSRVAIGEFENSNTGLNAGQVRVFDWNGTMWPQRGQSIGGEASNDDFGRSVSLSADGSRLAIGADNGGANNGGYAKIYELNGNTWVQLGADIDGASSGGRFGRSISLSSDGNRVAIGAPNNRQTRIYEWNGSTWVQVGLSINGGGVSLGAGFSVSLSSDGARIAIGQPFSPNPGIPRPGQVKVYDWNGDSWQVVGQSLSGDQVEDNFGYSVSLSGDGTLLAVGVTLNSDNGEQAGKTRVYEYNGDQWVQKGGDILGDSPYDNSGHSVSLSTDGNRLAIGTPLDDDSGIDVGTTKIFEWSGSMWVQVGVDMDGEGAIDYSGWSVSLSANGERLAIGTPRNDGNGEDAGHTRIYEITDGLLPVVYHHLQASVEASTVTLEWSTENEENNSGFEVEHSIDGRTWQVLGFVSGSGYSEALKEYQYDHLNPALGKNLYRLRQWDFDGSSTYSKIVAVNLSTAETLVRLYPNPVVETFWIEFSKDFIGQNVKVELLDLTGRRVLRAERVLAKAQNEFQLPEALASGCYILCCYTTQGLQQLRLLKT
ncbi:MAG: T9SS type A sorting domain-containing protein [Bacteroidota bacterium]